MRALTGLRAYEHHNEWVSHSPPFPQILSKCEMDFTTIRNCPIFINPSF